jgi:predicted RNase H-like nuclease (RuvC/YqgF family)
LFFGHIFFSDQAAKLKAQGEEMEQYQQQLEGLKEHIRSSEVPKNKETDGEISSHEIDELKKQLAEMTAARDKSDQRAKLAIQKIKVPPPHA